MKPWVTEMNPLPIEVPKEPTKGEFMNGDEVETIQWLIFDWCRDRAESDSDKVHALGKRLGVFE